MNILLEVAIDFLLFIKTYEHIYDINWFNLNCTKTNIV